MYEIDKGLFPRNKGTVDRLSDCFIEKEKERKMGETTKQERDQVFKRLRGIGPNKVNYDVHVCSKKGQGSKLL